MSSLGLNVTFTINVLEKFTDSKRIIQRIMVNKILFFERFVECKIHIIKICKTQEIQLTLINIHIYTRMIINFDPITSVEHIQFRSRILKFHRISDNFSSRKTYSKPYKRLITKTVVFLLSPTAPCPVGRGFSASSIQIRFRRRRAMYIHMPC